MLVFLQNKTTKENAKTYTQLTKPGLHVSINAIPVWSPRIFNRLDVNFYPCAQSRLVHLTSATILIKITKKYKTKT